MQILTSRSAVDLEDRQAIEQLIFTAKELAATAARTADFEDGGESNQWRRETSKTAWTAPQPVRSSPHSLPLQLIVILLYLFTFPNWFMIPS